MARVWQTYVTDCGRAYPLYPLSVRQVNQVLTAINPLDLLPNNDLLQLNDVKHPCSISNLTPRAISIWDVDGAQFLINYWQPFNQDLYDWLTVSIQVQAFEFIGERIKYSRLQRMLDNV